MCMNRHYITFKDDIIQKCDEKTRNEILDKIYDQAVKQYDSIEGECLTELFQRIYSEDINYACRFYIRYRDRIKIYYWMFQKMCANGIINVQVLEDLFQKGIINIDNGFWECVQLGNNFDYGIIKFFIKHGANINMICNRNIINFEGFRGRTIMTRFYNNASLPIIRSTHDQKVIQMMEHYIILSFVMGLIHSGLTYFLIEEIIYVAIQLNHRYKPNREKICEITRSVWDFSNQKIR